MRLAMEHGLERLTVEAIADAANVSRRTFSNYFTSKEEALLYGDQERVQELLDALRARPRDESPWTALTATARELVPHSSQGPDPEWVERARFIRSHPTLLSAQIAQFSHAERDLASELVTRMPPGERSMTMARLMAGCFLTAVRVATQAWLDSPVGTSLADVAQRVLAQAGDRFP